MDLDTKTEDEKQTIKSNINKGACHIFENVCANALDEPYCFYLKLKSVEGDE